MSQTVVGELDRCLGKRALLQLHLGPTTTTPPPSPSKRQCTMAARAHAQAASTSLPPPTATTSTSATAALTTAPTESTAPSRRLNDDHTTDWDATSWDTSLVTPMSIPPPAKVFENPQDGCIAKSVEESCKRALDHFPSPAVAFPTPTLEFDFRVAVTLKPEPSQVQGRAHKEITVVQSGSWSGSFGHGKVMAGGYDLGQARGFRPIRIVEGAFIMQTTDESPATLEMRTRGSLSGPCEVLDALLSTRNPKEIDPRRYGFRMFLTIKTPDKRYAEIVNCGLWVASGVWQGDQLIIDAYRVT